MASGFHRPARNRHLLPGCISKWHGIPKARALNEKEIDFIVSLIMEWIEEQLGGVKF